MNPRRQAAILQQRRTHYLASQCGCLCVLQSTDRPRVVWAGRISTARPQGAPVSFPNGKF